MKRLHLIPLVVLLLLALAESAPAPICTGCFSYQGQLKVNGALANGSYDLQFRLTDAATGGNTIGAPVSTSAVPVSGGKFTVTLDFGGAAFDGSGRWLEISARASGGGAFATLVPRQAILPVPSALFAVSAGGAITAGVARAVSPNGVSAASVQDASLTAAKLAGGEVVKSINGLKDGVTIVAGSNVTITPVGNVLEIAASSGGGLGASGWTLNGNSGTEGTNFLGTLDPTPLELRVNNRRVWHSDYSSYSPNIMAGSPVNYVSNGVYGATIAGGGEPQLENRVGQPWGTVSGGYANDADGFAATIGGGAGNHASAINSTVTGGYGNYATGASAVTAGGFQNSALKESATIGGGANNYNGQRNATIAGGDANHIDSTSDAAGAAIGGGSRNWISTGARCGVVAGGSNNWALNPYSTVGGGHDNVASSSSASFPGQTVGGGIGNSTDGAVATVGGGSANRAMANGATVGGGQQNAAFGENAVVPGGFANVASGAASCALGQNARAAHGASFVWNDGSTGPYGSSGIGQFCVQAAGGVRLASNTSLYCGTQTRQMLNLWGNDYGAGVQSKTLYFRTDGNYPGTGFAWYHGGAHSDAEYDPGAGGTMLMRLSDAELDVTVDIKTCGSVYASGDFHANSFCVTSDRNAKRDLRPIDPQEILRRLVALPLQSWAYTNAPAVRHIGPMAQDFRQAFKVGSDERHIATVDADGVAFSAIQALHALVQGQETELAQARQRIEAMQVRMDRLEATLGVATVVRSGGAR